MSYPPYQRSAKKNQIQQNNQLNDNPFRSTASSSSVPSMFRVEDSQIFQSGLGDRPSKRSRLDVESPIRMTSPSITPSRDLFNFMPDFSSLQKSSLSFTSFSPKRDQELVEARAKIKSLEISKDNLELKVGKLEAENRNLELKNRELSLQIEGLEKDKNFYNDREEETLKSLGNLEQENARLKQETARESQTLKDEIRELKQNLVDLKTESQMKENDLTRKLQTIELEATKLQYQVENLNEQIRQQHEISVSRQTLLDETQQRLDETREKLNELSQLSAQLDQIETLNKKVQEQSKYIKELESKDRGLTREIKHNKDLSPSIQILNYKLEKAEFELSQMSKLRREVAELEAENTALKREKISWASLLDQEKDNINSSTPYNVVKELISRRNDIELLRMSISSLEEKVKTKNLAIVDLEFKIKQLNYKNKAMENKFLNEIEASKGSKMLLQTEVKMLVDFLKSYDEEERHLQSNFDAQKMERIQNLENLIEKYKENLEISEKRASSVQQQKLEYPESTEPDLHSLEVMRHNEELTQTILKLENEKANLQKEISSLQNQINIYEQTELKAKAHSSELIKQNEVLQETIGKLKNENSSLRVEIISLDNQIDALERKLGDGEYDQATTRVWKAKAQEYREAVYSLLGYRVEFLENGRVRLTSMYSEQDDHSFTFTSDEDNRGTMQLVDGGNTEYIKSLDNLIKYWVVERGSIPCFLSSLTVDLFEKTTLGPIGREMDMNVDALVE